MINGLMQAHVSAVVQELREEMRDMREEVRRNSSHMAPVRVTGPRVRAQCSPARERGYTPQADLCFFLRDHGEDMGRWDGKPTSVLAARARQLKDRNSNPGNSSKVKVASTFHDRAAEYDLSDPLEGTSTMYARKEIKTRVRGALPLARERHRKTGSSRQCGSNGLAHQNHKNTMP